MSLYVEAKRSQKPWVIDGDIQDGKLTPRRISSVAGENQTARLKPNFTTEFGVMRLATMVPKTKGYELSVLELLEKPGIQEGVLKFDQEETVSLDSGSVKASRFTLSNPNTSDRTYWVDESGRLVKIRVYSRIELFLTDEKIATNIPSTPALSMSWRT